MTANGMKKGLTSYGDAEFSLFLRKAFVKAMGLSDDNLRVLDMLIQMQRASVIH